MTLSLSSSAFANGAAIPKKFTCEGKDVSPSLAWKDAPAGTKSFALIMDDPDAPPSTWIHWILYDLPGTASSLEEGLPKTETLPSGAKHGLCWGVDTFNRIGYHGPCPPPGKPHHYSFRIYALDKALGLPPRKNKSELLAAMRGHMLGEAELIGVYRR